MSRCPSHRSTRANSCNAAARSPMLRKRQSDRSGAKNAALIEPRIPPTRLGARIINDDFCSRGVVDHLFSMKKTASVMDAPRRSGAQLNGDSVDLKELLAALTAFK